MSEPRWLNEEEQQTWRAFLSASRLLMDQLDSELQHQAHMPHTYYEVLVRLSEAPERTMRMGELARDSHSSPSRMSHTIARMEEAGWVRRRRCRDDQRGLLAELTEDGMTTLRAAAGGHVEGVRSHLFDQLTREQVHQLRAISEALVEHLGRDD